MHVANCKTPHIKPNIYIHSIKKTNTMKNTTKDFTNWLEDMTFGFNNDFLDIKKKELNSMLSENDVKEIE